MSAVSAVGSVGGVLPDARLVPSPPSELIPFLTLLPVRYVRDGTLSTRTARPDLTGGRTGGA